MKKILSGPFHKKTDVIDYLVAEYDKASSNEDSPYAEACYHTAESVNGLVADADGIIEGEIVEKIFKENKLSYREMECKVVGIMYEIYSK